VIEISAGEVKKLFQPKKDYLKKVYQAKKNPLQMSAIAGRCMDDEKKLRHNIMAKNEQD
jgi:hypothetical protein